MAGKFFGLGGGFDMFKNKQQDLVTVLEVFIFFMGITVISLLLYFAQACGLI